MRDIDIKFYWNGNFLGHTHHMKVNGKEINLNLPPFSNTKEQAIKRIKELLKNECNLDYDEKNIKFTWGGRI